MAINLRLRQDAVEAVRYEARRTGRSQQDVIRDAVDRHLGLASGDQCEDEHDAPVSGGTVRRLRHPYRKATTRLTLPQGTSSAALLRRDELAPIVSPGQ